MSIIIRYVSNPGHTMCPLAATCGKSDRNLKTSWAISARASTYSEAALSERTCREWWVLMSRTGMAVEKRKFLKIPNWRHYLLKTRAKRKKKTQGNWVLYELKPRDVKRRFIALNSCFKNRSGRGFYIALRPAMKNRFTTIIPSAENHEECPDMPPPWRPDRIFTMSRLCSAFGGTSSVWCIISCWNRVKPSQGIRIERNWCVWAEHWKRNTTKLSSSITMLGSDPRTWELAAPTIDPTSSWLLPRSTAVGWLNEEETMSSRHLWWGPPAPTFWNHWCSATCRKTG